MKLRVLDRILSAAAGLLVVAGCAAIVAQTVFGVPVIGFAERVFGWLSAHRIVLVCLAVVLLALGLFCISLLFRRRHGQRGFVPQTNENGEVSVSVKAIDTLVRTCTDLHPEMQLLGTAIEPDKESVTIRLRVALASGVSIPLAMGALQKQVREYVTTCSGIDVQAVRVQVESMTDSKAASPYRVPELLTAAAPATSEPKADPAAEETADDRAAHQRIFGHADETEEVTVLVPPLNEEESEVEPDETSPETEALKTEEADEEAKENAESSEEDESGSESTEDHESVCGEPEETLEEKGSSDENGNGDQNPEMIPDESDNGAADGEAFGMSDDSEQGSKDKQFDENGAF